MTITGGKPRKINVSETTKAIENLKYIIFLLLHLDNNNHNIKLTTPNITDNINEDTVITPGNRPIDEIQKVINDKNIYLHFINELKNDLRPMKGKKDLNEQPFVDVIKTVLLKRVNLNYHYFNGLPTETLNNILDITRNIVQYEPARKKEIMDNVMFTHLSKENLNSVSLSKMISNDKPANNINIIYTLHGILNNLLYLKKIQCEQYAEYGRGFFKMMDNKNYFNNIEDVLKTLYTQLDIIEPIPKSKKKIQTNQFDNSALEDIKILFSTAEEEATQQQQPTPPAPPTAEEESIQEQQPTPPAPPTVEQQPTQEPIQITGKIVDDQDDDKDDEINTLTQTITNMKQQRIDNNNMKQQHENAIGIKGYTIPSKDGTGYAKNSKGNYLWNTSLINNNKDLPYNTTDTVDVYLHRLFTQIANETNGHLKSQSDQAEKHIENAKSVFEFKTGGKRTTGKRTTGKKTKGKKRYKNKSRRKYKK